jgi:hypothetical protein
MLPVLRPRSRHHHLAMVMVVPGDDQSLTSRVFVASGRRQEEGDRQPSPQFCYAIVAPFRRPGVPTCTLIEMARAVTDTRKDLRGTFTPIHAAIR